MGFVERIPLSTVGGTRALVSKTQRRLDARRDMDLLLFRDALEGYDGAHCYRQNLRDVDSSAFEDDCSQANSCDGTEHGQPQSRAARRCTNSAVRTLTHTYLSVSGRRLVTGQALSHEPCPAEAAERTPHQIEPITRDCRIR